jgi:hypothetical protein
MNFRFNAGHGQILKYKRNFCFENEVPRLSAIRDKMTEITSLPVQISGSETTKPLQYSVELAFACLPDIRVSVCSNRAESDRDEMSQYTVGENLVCVKALKTESTLLWTVVLALESLGGNSVSSRSDMFREERQNYNCHISESELLKRHRNTVFWSRIQFLILLLLSPVLIPLAIFFEAWNGFRK